MDRSHLVGGPRVDPHGVCVDFRGGVYQLVWFAMTDGFVFGFRATRAVALVIVRARLGLWFLLLSRGVGRI